MKTITHSEEDLRKYEVMVRNKIVITSLGCWEYPGRPNDENHSEHQRIRCGNKRRFYVHKLMYLLHKGCIPAGKVVRHKCNNARCVNPMHLQLGTQLENMEDLRLKNRILKGIENNLQLEMSI